MATSAPAITALTPIERGSDWLNPILVKETRQSLKSRQFVATFLLMLVASWLVAVLFRRYLWIFVVLSIPYGMMSALVAGSTASAEERRLGTADSQTLLPCPGLRPADARQVSDLPELTGKLVFGSLTQLCWSKTRGA